MCGIAAWIGGPEIHEPLEAVRRASELLRHRGPDDHGIVVFSTGEAYAEDHRGARTTLTASGNDDPAVVLAARRLAILDRSSAGHQPMISDDGRACVVLNGEIYNYIELRRELEGAGRRFRSHSDTEVLLQAFHEWGDECVRRLEGMFAFIAYDRPTGRVLVARDRAGMKPLYFARFGGGWMFASEVDALLEATGVDRTVNPAAVLDYLANGVVGGTEETLFRSVRQLPPGHAIRVEPSAARLEPYPYAEPSPDPIDVSFPEAMRLVRDALFRSVELHLRSDVPVGVMLSGGLDSSSLAVAMREIAGAALDLHTFSYVGHDGAFSEEPWIDEVNAAIGAIPHKIGIDPARWADGELRVRRQGGPCGSLAIFAQGELYRAAREAGITVALSGQGGDEVFAGYAGHALAMLRSLIRRGRIRRAGALSRGIGLSAGSLAKHSVAAFLPDTATRRRRDRNRRTCIAPGYARAREAAIRVDPLWSGPEAVQQTLAQGRLHDLPMLLRYEDRNSMMHTVEGRLPFLHGPLVELVASLPPEHLIGPGNGKHVLREAMRGLVPDRVLDRTDRVGFDVPHIAWARDVPAASELFERGLDLPPVDEATLRSLAKDAEAGTAAPLDLLYFWRVVGLAEWAEHFRVEWG